MAYDVIVENEWGVVRFEPTDKYVYHTFYQPISGEFFRELLNTALDCLIEKGAEKWLSDDRKNAEFTPEDIEFALADWGPRAAAAGWKLWALVVPQDIAGRASMTAIVSAFFELGVRVMVFTNVEEAREWLVSQ